MTEVTITQNGLVTRRVLIGRDENDGSKFVATDTEGVVLKVIQLSSSETQITSWIGLVVTKILAGDLFFIKAM